MWVLPIRHLHKLLQIFLLQTHKFYCTRCFERIPPVPTRWAEPTFLHFLSLLWGLKISKRNSFISEHYNHRIKDAFTGLQGFRCIVDDIVIYDRNVSEHIVHVHQFLIRCADMHIAGQMQVHATHGHFHLSAQEYQAHQSVTKAI